LIFEDKALNEGTDQINFYTTMCIIVHGTYCYFLGYLKRSAIMVSSNDGYICQAQFLSMHQKCELGFLWKYFEVTLNSMDTMIKEDLFTKQTSRLQENFFSDFLGL
jgi:hypothetical protein